MPNASYRQDRNERGRALPPPWPISAESAIYKGHPKSSRDKDFNNVVFCDMPSILQLPRNVKYKEWPDNLNSKERLTNLGYDAFTLMTNLTVVQNARLVGMATKTGHIFLNSKNRVERILDWAKFYQGYPSSYNG